MLLWNIYLKYIFYIYSYILVSHESQANWRAMHICTAVSVMIQIWWRACKAFSTWNKLQSKSIQATFSCKHFEVNNKTKIRTTSQSSVSTLTNVCEIRRVDLFDLVEAGIQVGRLFGQGGDWGHVWTDLLTVHWASQTHTQQACGQVCNTAASNKRSVQRAAAFFTFILMGKGCKTYWFSRLVVLWNLSLCWTHLG